MRRKHQVEYRLLKALSAVVRRLPYRAALALGWVLAALLFYVVRFRVRAAYQRLDAVFGDQFRPCERRRIAWTSLRNLCFNAVEILRFPLLDKTWVQQHVDARGVDFMKATRDPQQGAILAVPHMGNWDLAGVGGHILGLPIFFMARRQKNPLTDTWLNELRSVTGVETIMTDQSGALRKVIRYLKQGKVFAMLPDVRARESGIALSFLGGTAILATGMEMFARREGAPIFPAYALREGWTRHRWVVLPPVWPDPAVPRAADQARIMQDVMRHFEAAIRAHPEQYFWYNKRWILDPFKNPIPPPAP